MKAVVWHDVGDIRLDDVPEPHIEQPNDAIVRLTAAAICGTDLHFVRGTMSGMKPGTILGHEGVGVVEKLGPRVRNFDVGDRVVICSTHPHHGPAAKAAEQKRDQLEKERQKVAPKQAPRDGNWVAGDAPSQVHEWSVDAVAKAGTIGVIGVYPMQATTYPIGKAMGKNLTVKLGNCNHRAYVPKLVEMVRVGAIDPVAVLTKVEPLQNVIDAYRAFDKREPGWIKTELTLPQAAE